VERCGVVGIYSPNENHVTPLVCQGIYALQHRGQESCGIYAFNGRAIVGRRFTGLVADSFGFKELSKLDGHVGIGHVRYSTTARSTIAEAQPFYFESPAGKFALAFNGTITNFLELRKALEKKGHSFVTQTDTEVLVHLISDFLSQGRGYDEALEELMQVADGAYSLVLMNERGDLYGLRDPLGFKPLGIGSLEDGSIVIASESSAIETLGGKFEGDLLPGEVVRVNADGVKRSRIMKELRQALCMFEFVYFARPDSTIEGINVYEARFRLGEELARTHPADVDAVVPVPDSGRTAADGYSRTLGLPMVEGLIKNRYVWRTFIMPKQDVRELSVRLKLNPVKPLIQNRDIALVDDSIVRGTTMKRIVRLLKQVGAKSVHVRISCPRIAFSCYMGIDFPTERELIASEKTVSEIRDFLKADSLGYQTVEGLIKGIGLPRNRLCLACLTGEYPLRSKPDLSILAHKLGGRR
jgi:amidophosphoribosyltransferase